jgi:hypothetical protein
MSTVEAKPSLRSLFRQRMAWDVFSPIMNWVAMDSMFERMVLPRSLPAKPLPNPAFLAPT